MPVLRPAIGVAYLVLGPLAVVAAVAHLGDPGFGIGNLPPALVLATGFMLLIAASAWLFPDTPAAGVVRWLSVAFGALIGAYGLFGTAQIVGDFCSGAATAIAGPLMSSIPAGVDCSEVLPSLLIGAYMITVGGLSTIAAAVLLWRDVRSETGAALD